MPNTQSYIHGRILDYYNTSHPEYTPLFTPEEGSIEWGYTTSNKGLYRHLKDTELNNSFSDLKENNAVSIYHSLTEYDNPTESTYSEKQPITSQLGIKIETKSTCPSYEEWSTLQETAQTLQSLLENELPITFTTIRTGFDTIYVVSTNVSSEIEIQNLNQRMVEYINPHITNSLNVTEFKDIDNQDITTSTLITDSYNYIKKQIVSMKSTLDDALGTHNLNEYPSIDDLPKDEDDINSDSIEELSDQLEQIEGIGKTKSYQFLSDLNQREQSDITGRYLVNTSFNVQKITQYYLDKFIQTEWIADRDTITIQILGTHGLIPAIGTLSSKGAFKITEREISEMKYIPLEDIPSFYTGNTITISIKSSQSSKLEDILKNIDESKIQTDLSQLEADGSSYSIDEFLGMFLLTIGIAQKESE